MPGGTTLVPNGQTYEFGYRQGWGYATLQHRWRARRRTVRPEMTLGFGSCMEHSSVNSARWDSLGVLIDRTQWESTNPALGFNLGTGVSLGRGALHPGVDLHAHWAIAPETLWYTLVLKADWH